LESASRRGLLFAILAVAGLCLAPLALAAVNPEERKTAAEDQASDVHPWVAWAIDQVDPSHAHPANDDGSQGSGDGSGSDSSGGSGGSGSSPQEQGPLAPAHPMVVTVLHTADGALDRLPSDPIGFLGGQITPVQRAAEELAPILLPTQQGEASAPAPATASVTEVAPDASVPMLVATATAAVAAIAVLWLAGSSGSLGAGAAGAGTAGKLGATDLRRLLPFASPLFTRFEKDTVLGHPKREALYALILQDPGVSLQSLCDSTGLSRTAVTHHLRLMELQHLIVSKRMGRSRHYYENGGRFGRDQKDAYAVLQNDRSKAMAQFVKQNPGAIQKAICAAVGVQASVAHWHLRRLQDAQLVEAVRNGRTVAYFPGLGLKGMESAGVPALPPLPAAALPVTV
jgi:DNA-binding transcriptional ArsR family regulator